MKKALTIGTKMILPLLLLVGSIINTACCQRGNPPQFQKPYVRKTNVRILGLAVTEGSEMEVVDFFPDVWNPVDSLRFGLPKGISISSSPAQRHQVCTNGFKRYGLCFWECVLEISPSSYERLATEPRWFYDEPQQFVMQDGTKQVDMRPFLLARADRFPRLEITLQPRYSKGKEARSFRDLKSKL
jgi:hypothetical protein